MKTKYEMSPNRENTQRNPAGTARAMTITNFHVSGSYERESGSEAEGRNDRQSQPIGNNRGYAAFLKPFQPLSRSIHGFFSLMIVRPIRSTP